MGETDKTEKRLESTHNISTRSGNISRPEPSSNVDSVYAKCTICGNDRIQVKGKRMRNKFRICQEESALKFLAAMKVREDDISVKCADSDTADKGFAADVYCHRLCCSKYVTLPTDPDLDGSPPESNPKQELFCKALHYLNPLIQDRYGFTMTEVKELMYSLQEEDDVEIYNRDVKKFLLDHYGDNIQFCSSHKANESEMCFSSTITIEDIAALQKL